MKCEESIDLLRLLFSIWYAIPAIPRYGTAIHLVLHFICLPKCPSILYAPVCFNRMHVSKSQLMFCYGGILVKSHNEKKNGSHFMGQTVWHFCGWLKINGWRLHLNASSTRRRARYAPVCVSPLKLPLQSDFEGGFESAHETMLTFITLLPNVTLLYYLKKKKY